MFHVRTASRDDRLVARLIRCQLVEIGIGLGVRGVDLLQLGARLDHLPQALFHRLAHGHPRIELRLLRQVADLHVRHGNRLALEIAVLAGHDAQQGRFSRAVQAQHPDLGARKKGERDIFQYMALGRHDLAHAPHGVHILHRKPSIGRRLAYRNGAPRFGAGHLLTRLVPANRPNRPWAGRRTRDFGRRTRCRHALPAASTSCAAARA